MCSKTLFEFDPIRLLYDCSTCTFYICIIWRHRGASRASACISPHDVWRRKTLSRWNLIILLLWWWSVPRRDTHTLECDQLGQVFFVQRHQVEPLPQQDAPLLQDNQSHHITSGCRCPELIIGRTLQKVTHELWRIKFPGGETERFGKKLN